MSFLHELLHDGLFAGDGEGGGGGGGGGTEYAEHTVEFSLASSAYPAAILAQYVRECAVWMYYPTDADNTQLYTIAAGTWFQKGQQTSVMPGQDPPLAGSTSATGVTISPPTTTIYIVNDQSYDATRTRANINNCPAGDYCLKFYGIEV